MPRLPKFDQYYVFQGIEKRARRVGLATHENRKVWFDVNEIFLQLQPPPPSKEPSLFVPATVTATKHARRHINCFDYLVQKASRQESYLEATIRYCSASKLCIDSFQLVPDNVAGIPKFIYHIILTLFLFPLLYLLVFILLLWVFFL